MEKKNYTRNNHYVPQFYLREWSDHKENLWVLRKGNNIFKTNVKNTASKRDLYVPKPLSDEDLKYITKKITECNPEVFYSSINIVAQTSTKLIVNKNINVIEDYYTDKENILKQIIENLKNKNYAILKDGNINSKIITWIFIQFFRSKSFINGFIEMNKDKKILDLENIAKYLGLILPFDAAVSYANGHSKICVLENRTSLDFLTSDMPSVCFRNLSPEQKINKNLDVWYYPVSRKVALVINANMKGITFIDEVSCVESWNKFLFHFSELLISNTKDELLKYVK